MAFLLTEFMQHVFNCMRIRLTYRFKIIQKFPSVIMRSVLLFHNIEIRLRKTERYMSI